MTGTIEARPEYTHLRIGDDIVACRDSGGAGAVVLFLHGFASFSWTWEAVLRQLPPNLRCIRPDFAGFGFSLADPGKPLSVYEQAELIKRLIFHLDLRRITLVGHGYGGVVAMLLAPDPRILSRLDRICLIATRPPDEVVPDYIMKLASLSLTGGGRVLEFARSRFLARVLLRYVYGRDSVIPEHTLDVYSAMLRHPGRLDSIIRAAGEYIRNPENENLAESLSGIELPTLILIGEKDTMLSQESQDAFGRLLRNSRTLRLPGCGHIPQEEAPEMVAKLLTMFIGRRMPDAAVALPPKAVPPAPKRGSLLFSRVFDRWCPGMLSVIACLRLLQFFRLLGLRAEAHGWRKLTTVFLRGEYSKFMLASFRLNYCSGAVPASVEAARKMLLQKLYGFLLIHQELHWTVEPGVFSFGRRRISTCDIVEARVDCNGFLISLFPLFDRRNPHFNLSEEQKEEALDAVVRICNQFREANTKARPGLIKTALKMWVRSRYDRLHILTRRNVQRFVERVMSAAFIFIEVLPASGEGTLRRRFRTPDLRNLRHPGWGMLCIAARFTADLREVDLWFQFNHITADGAPMQEVLDDLKRQWGAAGPVVYPALNGLVSAPETQNCGDGVYRARVYIDMSPLLRVRKILNERYTTQMNGAASLAGLLMWGLAAHPVFRDRKMLLPIDAGISQSGERELGLLIIRPGIYRSESAPLRGFLRFQKEMNRRMADARHGYGESHEFLSLCTMLHPFFYHVANVLAPFSLNEIVGTMGISIIRDAEMFISPMTDFQKDGFVTLGSVRIPTENGGHAGALCICGSRPQIRNYLAAVRHFVRHYPETLGLSEENFSG